MKRLPTVLALVLVFAACGGGAPPEPPAPPPLDPTGTYALSIQGDGMQVGGSMTIRESPSGYTGSIDTDMGGAALADITVSGDEMTFSVPEAGVSFHVVFDGDTFTGGFDGAMGVGTIRGTKRGGG